MKLVHCLSCGDILQIRSEERRCSCGETVSKILNAIDVEVAGTGLVIGLDNNEFVDALQRFMRGCDRVGFSAFIFQPQEGAASFFLNRQQFGEDSSRAVIGHLFWTDQDEKLKSFVKSDNAERLALQQAEMETTLRGFLSRLNDYEVREFRKKVRLYSKRMVSKDGER